MNDVMQTIGRRMPSADWVAFGVAVICSVLGTVVPWLNLLVPIAIFLPSILRELGVLKDGDEYTRRIMHRAGFHALLVAALLVFATWGMVTPGRTPLSPDLLTGETLRKVIMYTFVVSYLLQYWGGRDGAFRILLGIAFLSVLPLYDMISQPWGTEAVLIMGGIALFVVVLAFLVRRWPRLGGVALLAIFLFAVTGAVELTDDPMATVAVPSLLLQACILPGAMGVALLVSSRSTDEDS